jgi:hypothetical protein
MGVSVGMFFFRSREEGDFVCVYVIDVVGVVGGHAYT